MDDFEEGFEKEISRFIWAKCHIKLNHAIHILGNYMAHCKVNGPEQMENGIKRLFS